MSINVLSTDLIPKIAAGEVVDRPASLVKELIENSLDAGAANIHIDIEESGLSLIRVVDDGSGIAFEDLAKIAVPFNTSKISTEHDLYNIKSFGFRGEALASIGAVSVLEIKSKSVSAAKGGSIKIINGLRMPIKTCALNTGTIVDVRDLYLNRPARKKFLKDAQYEFQQILGVITSYTIAYPEIAFKLSHNGKVVYSTSKEAFEARIRTILSSEIATKMLPINYTDKQLSIKGIIGKPQIAQKGTLNSFVYVNKRPVYLKTVLGAVTRAYGRLIPHDLYPPFILFIDLPTDLVDVNVHPQKHEVRFWDDTFVLDTLSSAIKDCLQKADLTYVLDGDSANFEYEKGADSSYLLLKDSANIWKPTGKPFVLYEECFQIGLTYIATPLQTGVLLVDQHAAHESILYEELHKAFVEKTQSLGITSLDKPFLISLSLKESRLLRDNLDLFSSMGFSISEFGPSDFLLHGYPSVFSSKNAVTVIVDYLADINSLGHISSVDSGSQRTVAFLACRSAVKAGDYLSHDEQVNILKKLDELKNLYACPHGRPIKVIVTSSELGRMFRRLK